jgi:hypothetical protein
MRKGLSAVGSRASGENKPAGELPTPDGRQPTAREPNWRLIYSAVIIELAILILIFYAFTKAFA